MGKKMSYYCVMSQIPPPPLVVTLNGLVSWFFALACGLFAFFEAGHHYVAMDGSGFTL